MAVSEHILEKLVFIGGDQTGLVALFDEDEDLFR
jgi:hypothetical protein